MVDDAVIPRGVAEMGDREEAIVHFDGACQPARGGGVATYGFTIDSAHGHLEDAGLAVAPGIPHSTNNVAEYCAAIRALEQLVEDGYRGRVIVRGDSQLVIRQMTGEYEVRTEHLVAYHERLRKLLGTF